MNDSSRASPRRYCVLMVSSSGGVLLDLLALEPWWRLHHTDWAVVKAPDTESALVGQRVHWIRETPRSRPWALPRCTIEAWRLVHSLRPEIIISAGSGAAVAFFVVAKLASIPSIWIETLNLLDHPGMASRVCARLASEALFQREQASGRHRRGILVGELY